MTRPVFSDADRTDAFRGLAHPLRRKVLATLGKGERSAGDLLTGLGLTQPALSRHLKVLRDTGLVKQRTEGHRRFYRVNTPTLRKAQRWFQQIG